MTKSLSRNLIKCGCAIQQNDNTKIIDTNEMFAKRLEILQSVLIQNDKQLIDGAQGGSFNEPFQQGEFFQGLEAERVEELLEEKETQEVFATVNKEEMLEEAKAEIEEMRRLALENLENEKELVFQQAKRQGNEEGYRDGFQQAIDELNLKEEQLRLDKKKLELDYQKKVEQLEPLFIQELNDIYQHVFKVDMSKHRDVIMHLLDNAISKIEGSKDFIIRISKDDFPFVSIHKKQLLAQMNSTGGTIEMIEDSTMQNGQCLIETEGGIYDCGIDTQLSELQKELSMLSYSK